MPVKAKIKCKLSEIGLRMAIDDWTRENGGSVSFPDLGDDTIHIHFVNDSQAEKLEEICKKNNIEATFKKL